MSSNNVSEFIRQAVVRENNNFGKVITDTADGLKRSGFFEKPDWKILLEQCFETKRLGLTSEEIQIYSSVLSDQSSYENTFVNGLCAIAESTPLASVQMQKGTDLSRLKRSSTLVNDATPPGVRKKPKTSKNLAEQIGLAGMLVDLNETDWSNVLPTVNARQKTVKYVTPIEQCKQLRESNAVVHNAALGTCSSVSSPIVTVPMQNLLSPRCAITKRRNAIYLPAVKKPINSVQIAVPSSSVPSSSVPSSSAPKSSAPKSSVPSTVARLPNNQPTTSNPTLSVPESSDVLTNITNRRMTRRQTKLLAAYSGNGVGSTTKRRSTVNFERTSVLFTMIDTAQYRNVLQTYNIFVADTNEKYDYVIAEKICRSAKFLSAVVSGKPIVSLDWIHALKQQKDWLDPLNYLLKDDDGEREYNFELSVTLKLATNRRLFENYSILVTPKVTSADSLKDVIFSGGAKYLRTTLVPRKGDEVICISTELDKSMWPKLHSKYPTLKQIISLDGFSKMIFQYNYHISHEDILHQF